MDKKNGITVGSHWIGRFRSWILPSESSKLLSGKMRCTRPAVRWMLQLPTNLSNGEQGINPGSAGVPPAPVRSGWRSRGYLPHFDQPGLVQMVTFRLADALPVAVLAALDRDSNRPKDAERRQRLEAYLDAGNGGCYLRDTRIARLVETALLHFDGIRYHLLAWVVMPNHVHALIETLPGHELSDVSQAWK